MRRVLLLSGAILLGGATARAQEPPILETSARAFGGREGTTYYGASLERGGWFLKGVGGKKGASVRSGRPTLLHGGTDFELGGTLRTVYGVAPQIGVSVSDTGSRRNRGFLTARARFERGMLSVEPRAVLGRQALVGVGFGATKKLSEKLTISGSVTPIVSGQNGVSSSTGLPNRTTLFEASVTRGKVSVGATNALGATTGFSLSPSIGGAAAFVKVRVSL